MTNNPFLDAALRYANRGWRVFPLKPRGKTPLTKHGYKDATVATSAIKAWWGRWPNANVGIATGAASGLVVLDVDGVEGAATLCKIIDQGGGRAEFDKYPPLGIVFTARGFHLYYDLPLDKHDLRCSTGGGLDVRANGGYVVAPPSVHESGHVYTWGPVEEPVL